MEPVRGILHLSGVVVLDRQRSQDKRGSLERLFAADGLAAIGTPLDGVHTNLTLTTHPGTFQGLHMQRQPHAETKSVTCLSGRIFATAVDLRPKSPTYGCWLRIELSPDKTESLLIPEESASGMQCLEPNSAADYGRAAACARSAETEVHPLDPDVAVAWLLPPKYLSRRDQSQHWLDDLQGAA